MAKERGWGNFSSNVDLSDCDRDYVAEMIKQGYTSGEIPVSPDEDDEE